MGAVCPEFGAAAGLDDLRGSFRAPGLGHHGVMSGNHEPEAAGAGDGVAGGTDDTEDVEVGALAITVTIPEDHRWTDTRRGVEHTLLTLTVRLLPDGHLAVKAYGRPTAGGRAPYVSFSVPDDPVLTDLVSRAASRAGAMWSAHRGLP